MTIMPTTGSIRAQVLRALDPDGRMQRDIEAARHLPAGAPFDELRRFAAEHEANITLVERYWEPLTERGWGIANVGLHVLRTAGALLHADDATGADAAIAAWFDEQWIARIIALRTGGTRSKSASASSTKQPVTMPRATMLRASCWCSPRSKASLLR